MGEGDATDSDPGAPGAGWHPVPGKPEYERFWDGQRWSSERYWGIAGGVDHQHAPPPTDPQAWTPREVESLSPTMPSVPYGGAPGSQHHVGSLSGVHPAQPMRFYAITMFIVPPVFILSFVVIAVSALPSHAGRPVGIAAAVLAVLFVLVFSRKPYVAIVAQDESLMFKALVGSKETTVSRISRISLRTGTRGASSWIFQFDDDSASLGDIGGKALARYHRSQPERCVSRKPIQAVDGRPGSNWHHQL